jgi:hypothetical protein
VCQYEMVAYFKTMSQRFPEESNENLGIACVGSRFEPGAFHIGDTSAVTATDYLID